MNSTLVGFYNPETLEGALGYMAEKRVEFALKTVSNDILLLCNVSEEAIERDCPKVSFWNSPYKYLHNNKYRKIYNKVIKNLISNLDGKDKAEKYYAVKYLNFVKNRGVKLPKILDEKISGYPDNYLSQLESELSS